MTGATAETSWERISVLRPQLHSHLCWYRHHYRGKPWWVLQDAASMQHYYLTEDAYRLLAILDGEVSLAQARNLLKEADTAPSTDEVAALIGRLQAADLLRFDAPVAPSVLFQRWRKRRSRLQHNAWLRPLAIRFPLIDPSRLLDTLLPFARPLFGRLPFIAWLVIVGIGILLGLQHQTALADHGSARFLDPLNLVLLWLAYPLVKGLHEMGHAFAIRVWGGNVRELGIMLLVFVPVPYVDGSAANAFPDKRRRVLVGAAGIMVEALLASLALFLWLSVQPGLLRDLAFDVMVIGGVSTLLFNGNPLLRFDGYFVLADAIEIPNLARRSQQYYGYLARRYLLGITDAVSPVVAGGERAWFLFYGAASYAYGVFISLVIALYIAGKFFIVGSLLAIYVVAARLFLPLLRLPRHIAHDPGLQGYRVRATAVSAGGVFVLSLLLLALPVPSNTIAQGVLRLPEKALIRAAGSGEVVVMAAADGQEVYQGDLLLQLQDPKLKADLQVLEARHQELLARLEQVAMNDRVEASILREQLDEIRAETRSVQRRLEDLDVVSPVAGVLDLQRSQDLPGRYIEQGEVLGLVRNHVPLTARLVIPQQQAARVRDHTLGIDLKIGGADPQRLSVGRMHAVPAGTHQLPNASLGSQGGGSIAVDARDALGTTAVDPVFYFDLELPVDVDFYYPGARVQARFRHSSEPLGPRWYRSLRQLLLARLGV